MLLSIKQLYGHKLGASDGEFGHVKDFYFDDRSWAIRYIVADTGSWLTGRQVLISPHSLGRLAPDGKILRVKLTRAQIEKSPPIESHKTVSRQYEEEYHQYYGWPYYWQGDALWGMSGVPMMELPIPMAPINTAPTDGLKLKRSDAHLRSAQAVNGYHLHATDGEIGHLCDFMVDDHSWAIAQLVIKTGHRLSGPEVQIPTSDIARISYEESTLFVNLNGEAVVQSPAHYMASADAS